ncbi:MAG: hypothetical protein KKC46_00655 [Proteobacteria bacterium]|nr:hypothetical protein [Pseudomonadota bacterium]
MGDERKVVYSELFKNTLDFLAAGRDLDEQIRCINETGNHAPTWLLRSALLSSIGLATPKQSAENFLVFGCYIPFMAIPELQASIKLLNLTDIDYTYSPDKEVCCGAPIWEDTVELVDMEDERRKEIQSKCKGFMEMNNSLGKKAQAANMIYMCHNCASLARRTFNEDKSHHLWIYDLLVDRLHDRALEIEPATYGYYKGCHRHFPSISNLGWKTYREFLGGIKGLTLIDLNNKQCCREDAVPILKEAVEKGVKEIIVPCGDGNYQLHLASQAANIPMKQKSLSSLLLDALER